MLNGTENVLDLLGMLGKTSVKLCNKVNSCDICDTGSTLTFKSTFAISKNMKRERILPKKLFKLCLSENIISNILNKNFQNLFQ